MDFEPVADKPADLAEVHLFTGVNGTGKTRLLAVLAAMLGGSEALMKRVKDDAEAATLKATDAPHRLEPWFVAHLTSGNLSFASPSQFNERFANWCQQVPAFAYHGVAYVTDANIEALAGVPRPKREACLSFFPTEKHSQPLLQAIANLKLQAAMDSLNPENGKTKTRSTQIIQTLESTMTEITGQPFLFRVTAYPQPVLCVRWANSDLSFDLLPDGLRSIIGSLVDAVVMFDAWIQGRGNILDMEAVFLLDEPESHLHPVWQRRVLPAFQRLFPKAQIFVATHSPFVISSLNHGLIHRLVMDQNGLVTAAPPQQARAGDSYISVLEEIMGLEEWYDPETEKLLADFRAEREKAFQGDAAAKAKALEMAQQLGNRSMELRYVMGRELNQMERRLGKPEGR